MPPEPVFYINQTDVEQKAKGSNAGMKFEYTEGRELVE